MLFSHAPHGRSERCVSMAAPMTKQGVWELQGRNDLGMELMVESARGQLRVRLLPVPQTYTKRCVPSGMRWGAGPEKGWCLGPETRLAYRVLTP